jgi:hemolysin activation/secretion protein
VTITKYCAVTLGLLAVGQGALAQQPVGAGGQIQQIPPAPTLRNPAPVLPAPREQPRLDSQPAGAKIQVKVLRVTGQTVYSEGELVAATGFKPGSELTLPELRAMAALISSYYNARGYVVAQAYLPAQDIVDGVVTIAVVEGRYGKVSLLNETNVSDRLASGYLDGLNSGDAVAMEPLERRLLLLSDLPGVGVRSTLTPGAAVGTSDLIVNLTPGRRVTGSVEADNSGNPYTGQYRLGAAINLNEPLGIGDVLSARYLGSTTGGLNYGRVAYQAQVEAATVGVSYAIFDYRLGRQFAPLHASGSEQIASLYGSYPLIRSYNNNLRLLADIDYRTFQDKVGLTSTTVDKQAWVLNAGIAGDFHDMWGGGGWNSYSLIGTFGDLDIQSPLARAIDAATAQTDGTYAKASFSVSRLQVLAGPFTLYGSVRGQIAANNLDISEKMELGGAYGVRAYPEGESYGDDGYIATLEARMLLPKWSASLPGEMHLIGFIDTGYVRYNTSPWMSGSNDATRTGVGVGLTWADANNFSATVAYAHEIGGERATSAPDRFGRFWFQLVKYF